MGNDVAKNSPTEHQTKASHEKRNVHRPIPGAELKKKQSQNITTNHPVDETTPQSTPTTTNLIEGGFKPGMFIHQKQGKFSDRYTGVKILGKGSFGEVILCRDKLTGLECAVKVIAKSSVKKGTSPTTLLKEIELLKQLDHPNIIKLFEFFEDAGYFYLVTEVYTGGELFDKIVKQKRFDLYDAAKTMKQILSGINYMHHNSIVHRDIKPENLLLENDSPDALIKIIDFGLSTFCVPRMKMKDKIGTAYYIAPEVLGGSYTEKCDIWSAGVILYILITGRPPFNGSSETTILSRVTTGQYSTRPILDCVKSQREAQCVENLIRHMLMFVPSLRYTAQQCLDHEFITRLCSTRIDFPRELGALQCAVDNVTRFQASQKLAKAALLYMGSKLTSLEETRHLTRIFEKLDRNGDGELDLAELKCGYRELMRLKGVESNQLDKEAIEADVHSIFEAIDFDKNGSVSYSEFITACMDQKILVNKTRLQRAFDLFDVDGSGKISSEELQKIFCMSGLNKAECDSMIKSVDSNNDGEIDLDEFEKMLTKLLSAEGIADIISDQVTESITAAA